MFLVNGVTLQIFEGFTERYVLEHKRNNASKTKVSKSANTQINKAVFANEQIN
jgi:hypothetical protein